MAPVKVYWYDGLAHELEYGEQTVARRWRNVNKREWQYLPPLVLELEKKYDRNFGRNGSLLIGDKGIMTIGDRRRLPHGARGGSPSFPDSRQDPAAR